MPTPENCRARAEECRMFASMAKTKEAKEALLELAAHWKELAKSDGLLSLGSTLIAINESFNTEKK